MDTDNARELNYFEQHPGLNVSWSLSPLLRGWMRILGCEPPRKRFHLLWCIQRWTFFLLLAAVHLYTASLERRPTSIKSWIGLFNYGNWIFRAIAVHLSLLIALSQKWNVFRDFIGGAGHFLNLKTSEYYKIRKATAFAILLIIILVNSY